MRGRTASFRPFDLPELPAPEKARHRWLQCLPRWERAVEEVDVWNAAGRVLGTDVRAQEPIPAFSRSLVDGVALRAADTADASSDRPRRVRLLGRIIMGEAATREVGPGEAVLVPTGGMLPPGADAVLMVEEFPELLAAGDAPLPEVLLVRRRAREGENVIPAGADVRAGEVVLPRGRRLRPQDVGMLAGLGMRKVPVFTRPEVAILSTGSELVGPEREPRPGQIRDMNAVALAAMVAQAGGLPRVLGIVSDEREALLGKIRTGLESDMLVLSGGSSVGEDDWVARLISEWDAARIVVHGVRLAPGKPTLLALVGQKPVLGLPGNPVSALVVFRLFGLPALYRIAGQEDPPDWRSSVRARLTQRVVGPQGRALYLRVALMAGPEGEWLAEPVPGGSHQLMTMVRSDGYVVVPPDRPLEAGDWVEVVPWFPGP